METTGESNRWPFIYDHFAQCAQLQYDKDTTLWTERKGKVDQAGLKKGDQLALLNAGVQISDICVCFGCADNNKSNMSSTSNKANNNNHNNNKNNPTKATVKRT